jgi:hypothetical protein
MITDGRYGETVVNCPIFREMTIFSGPDNEWLAHTHEKLARKYWYSILEVYEMVQLAANSAIFGEVSKELEFTTYAAIEEVKSFAVEAKWDADRLSDDTPLAEVLEILARNHDRMARLAELEPDPVRRKLIEDFLITSAASLQASYNRARERLSNG